MITSKIFVIIVITIYDNTMANKFVSSRISPELEKTLEDYCKSNNTTKSVVLIEALHQYLNFPKPIVEEQSPEIPGVTIEMFNALQNEVKDLAKSQEEIKQFILNSNGKNEISTEIKIEDNPEVKHDKKDDNSDNNIVSNTVIVIDNKDDNNSKNEKQYEGISTSEIGKITNIGLAYAYRLKEKADRILGKQGKLIKKNQLLNEPIEIEYKDGIFIDNAKYKLFYMGQNPKGKDIWNLIPSDNNCNQMAITDIKIEIPNDQSSSESASSNSDKNENSN
jgi:hypothetical protein